jgi:ribonuclease T2
MANARMPARVQSRRWLLAVALLCAGTAGARHHRQSGDAEPGVFDYYLLSLSWSPAYCLQSPGAEECQGPRRYAFIVHGLWPQNERGWPENCGVRSGVRSGARSEVPDDVVRGIADLMPARGLVYHEWSAHGTCSGLEPADFFALVRRAYRGVAIPAPLSQPAEAAEQSPDAIAQAFMRANPSWPAQSVVVTCSNQGAPRLREVHLCMDRKLSPRACSADAQRGACRAPQVIIPPVR